MKNRIHCNRLLKAAFTMSGCLKYAIEGSSEEILNYSFAEHKMTIAQMAVHTMSWPRYFLSAEKPWEVDKFTCRPCKYPIKKDFINKVIDDGLLAIKEYLASVDDKQLDIANDGSKGKGYLVYRLIIHIMTHAEQIAFLRSMLEPDWNYSKQFGKMATELIGISYTTEKDSMFGES
ncbi:MAG: hypothetical protein JEY94_07900 [Melioribacteraceae bacterium]|nr:hypothetical protein [Melioribacteraceae bacterium]